MYGFQHSKTGTCRYLRSQWWALHDNNGRSRGVDGRELFRGGQLDSDVSDRGHFKVVSAAHERLTFTDRHAFSVPVQFRWAVIKLLVVRDLPPLTRDIVTITVVTERASVVSFFSYCHFLVSLMICLIGLTSSCEYAIRDPPETSGIVNCTDTTVCASYLVLSTIYL